MAVLRAKQMADTKLTLQEAMTQAVAAHKAGELAKAERLYMTILDADPDHADALQRLGVIECQRGRSENGIRLMETALLIDPRHAGALHNRGNAFFELARLPEAIKSYRQALAVRKDAHFHSNLIFALNFDERADAAQQQAERARWYEAYARTLAPAANRHGNDPDPNRRLRIGYVSAHFRAQAATYAFGGVIVSHDPDRFEVVCYSDTAKEDELTARFRASVHKWHRTTALSDQELSELIRSDRIDILVDCVGHMRGHRLFVFARKPAPIQVTAWGEPTGTGLKTIDYLFADPVLVPASERALLAERVYDLPNFLGHWQPDALPEPGAPPAVANGYVTFGAFNRYIKAQDPVLRTWAAILRALPRARLLLKWNEVALTEGQQARVNAIFAAEGVDGDRVRQQVRTERANHFAAYQDVDIMLDPFPHGGGITTLDALWMGVPVVTWRGSTISSRLAAASLTALNLTDFIASDVESYVRLAIAKASDVDSLAKMRAGLRERVAGSAIGDPKRYTRAVEAAYVDIWKAWCAGGKGPVGSPSNEYG